MIEAAERHGVQLLCGGSRSSSAVVRKVRQVIVSGDLGRLHAMTTWSAEVPLTETRGAYAPECDELYDALVYGKPVLHSGRWGLATLEVCLAIMQSATEHRDIPMQHQVAVPDGA